MITKLGEIFSDFFRRNMPDAFVFALVLTLLTAAGSFLWVGSSPLLILESWYKGFWMLLEFGMQMLLMIVTGYSIALSPIVNKGIDRLSEILKTPIQVYLFVIILGGLLCLVSWGWVVITAVLARELALRVKGIHYPYLIACVYLSHIPWVTGISSSIPLLLNTPNNFLIEAGILEGVIPVSETLGSNLNLSMLILSIILSPVILILLIPKIKHALELKDMLGSNKAEGQASIKEEASTYNSPYKTLSDRLNNGFLIPGLIVLAGLSYLVFHFYTYGFDLNLNIVIFAFIILGLALHKTPMRYGLAMKRASSNVSGIIFQFPFYAGIMGIMIYAGLGEKLALLISTIATIDTYPFFAYLAGGIVNFAIPSAGGEFAVIGPSIINAVKEIGIGLPESEIIAMISRAAMSISYGEALSNALQPFYLLLILPIMASKIKIQARDVMGYMVIPFLIFFIFQSLLVVFMPL